MTFQGLRTAHSLFLTGGEGVTIGRMLAFGSLVWGTYSLVQFPLNGVVLNELVVPAQIITGTVRYPPALDLRSRMWASRSANSNHRLRFGPKSYPMVYQTHNAVARLTAGCSRRQ